MIANDYYVICSNEICQTLWLLTVVPKNKIWNVILFILAK
jgi:hypothetical protein